MKEKEKWKKRQEELNKFNMEAMDAHKEPTKLTKDIRDVKDLVGQTIKEVRSISFNLMPSVLDDYGISSALKLLSEQLSLNLNTKVIFETEAISERFDNKIEIGLYRIAQEAINNALKYSLATEIRVGLISDKKEIELYIIDNGIGFDLSEKLNKIDEEASSHGLKNMQQRAKLINGNTKFISHKNKGTKVYVWVSKNLKVKNG